LNLRNRKKGNSKDLSKNFNDDLDSHSYVNSSNPISTHDNKLLESENFKDVSNSGDSSQNNNPYNNYSSSRNPSKYSNGKSLNGLDSNQDSQKKMKTLRV